CRARHWLTHDPRVFRQMAEYRCQVPVALPTGHQPVPLIVPTGVVRTQDDHSRMFLPPSWSRHEFAELCAIYVSGPISAREQISLRGICWVPRRAPLSTW